jgi:gliding motility-associated-like protein
MKRKLLVFIFLLSANWVQAFHIAGGDLTSKWLFGNTFEIKLTLYRDCSNPNAAYFDPTIIIAAYTLNGSILQDSFHVDLTSVVPLEYSGAGCVQPPQICMQTGTYIRNIQLPAGSGGYYLVWERCCRNSTIVNLQSPSQTGMAFYHEMADPALMNSSPAFNSPPLPYTCVGQLFRFSFFANDLEGDSLVYEMSTPLAGGNTTNQSPNPFSYLNSPGGQNLIPPPAPYSNSVWDFGYGISDVCASAVPLVMNSETGLVEGVPDVPGFYAMAANVYEYRNGILIGIVRREIEFTVLPCTGNAQPNVSPSIKNANYEIYASDTLCFDAVAKDPDGDSLYLIYKGDVFSQSPAPGLLGPYAFTSDTSGVDSLRVTFCWYTQCYQGRDSVYKVQYEITDNGCPLPLTTLGKVTILVKPVPVIEKPNLLCLELQNTLVKVNKNPQPEIIPRYFSNFRLYRSTNGSNFQLIQSAEDPSQITFVDSSASNPTGIDYCYFIIATNSCGVESFHSDTLCSITQINETVNYIKSVSVVRENQVSLQWEDFPDGEYGTYVIERRINQPNSGYIEVARLKNYTTYSWDDADVFTSEYSYCYRMKNFNFCENESAYSNDACTILLEGESKQFSNRLQWNEYVQWKGAVMKYELSRSESKSSIISSFIPYAELPASSRIFEDEDIPLKGGVYYYKIQASEGQGSYNATSLSNEVELVQPPLLYIPNAFSPNGDGGNNTWGPAFSFVKSFELTVFNRWGQRVFSTSSLSNTWDGKFNGVECQQGVYLFKIKFFGFDAEESYEKLGTVTLLR